MTTPIQIGFLVPRDSGGYGVICNTCEENARKAGAAPLSCRLFDANVHPYKQSCHTCNRLVYGKADVPIAELYPNEVRDAKVPVVASLKERLEKCIQMAKEDRQLALLEALVTMKQELFEKPKSNPDADGFFKWTVEIEVRRVWVGDGFDMTDRRMHDIMCNHLRFAASHEIKARVIEAPPDALVAEAQGYGSVKRYLKERIK